MKRPTRASLAGNAYLDLQDRARKERRGTQELLTLYVVERWLARLRNGAARAALWLEARAHGRAQMYARTAFAQVAHPGFRLSGVGRNPSRALCVAYGRWPAATLG
jgi:hypothetical protein